MQYSKCYSSADLYVMFYLLYTTVQYSIIVRKALYVFEKYLLVFLLKVHIKSSAVYCVEVLLKILKMKENLLDSEVFTTFLSLTL